MLLNVFSRLTLASAVQSQSVTRFYTIILLHHRLNIPICTCVHPLEVTLKLNVDELNAFSENIKSSPNLILNLVSSPKF